MVLEMQGLTKFFGKRKVLDNVTVSVSKGEILGFIGPNGAGKTTAIKIMLGLLKPDAGEIFINGFDITKDFENALVRVGGIIESPDLYNYLTGYDNLMLTASMYGLGKERVLEVAEQVKLLGRLNDKVKKYSLGMRQRLGVAQALINKPNLLVLDEPTNGLDPVGIKELRDMLRELAKSGVAVFISSHQLAEMELICDTFCIIEQGVVVSQMPLAELLAERAGENRLRYTITVDNVQKALTVLENAGYTAQANGDNSDMVNALALKEEMPDIIRVLVKENISVYSAALDRRTLEQAFLDVTHGSKSQIA